MQFDDNLLIGPATPGGAAVAGLQAGNDTAGSSPQFRGVGPLGRNYVYDVVPLALGTANLAALQTTAGAGNLTLTAGTGVTSVVVNGQTRLQFDVPRAVSLTSAANVSAVNFTISGFDIYGQPMSQLIAGPNANTVTTLKAFWQIVSIAASAAVASNTSAGSSDRLGLPVICSDRGYIDRTGWNNALAADAGTLTPADATSPATTATGDVRGTYTPSSATDGAKRLIIEVLLPSAAVGPKATRVGAFGVNQV
jgi:hypothetical protein